MFRLRLLFCLWLGLVSLNSSAADTVQLLVDSEAVSGSEITKGEHATISMSTSFSNGSIFYTLDGSEPSATTIGYTSPFTITATKTVRAIAYSSDFSQTAETGPLTVNIFPYVTLVLQGYGGTIIADPAPSTNGKYLSNSVVHLTAVPADGWTFLDWQGALSGSVNPTDITMNGNKSVSAYFGAALTIDPPTHGSILVQPDVAGQILRYGTPITLTPIPDPGYYLVTWGGSASGASNPLQYSPTTPNPEISALFQSLPLDKTTLSVYAEQIQGGSVLVQERRTYFTGPESFAAYPGTNVYTAGEQVLVFATPKPGWAFTGWAGDVAGQENPLALTLSTSIVAHARFQQGAILSTHADGGAIIRDPDLAVYPIGAVVTLRATPDSGYSFERFGTTYRYDRAPGGLAYATENPLTIVITNDIIVHAEFAFAPHPPKWNSPADGGYYRQIAVATNGTTFVGHGNGLRAIANTGEKLWDHPIPYSGGDAPPVNHVAIDSDGNIAITAGDNRPFGNPQFQLIKSDGSLINVLKEPGGVIVGRLAINPDGSTLLEAKLFDNKTIGAGIQVVKRDGTFGDEISISFNYFGSTWTEKLSRPAISPSGDLYLCGIGVSNALYSLTPSRVVRWRREIEAKANSPMTPYLNYQQAPILGTSAVYVVTGSGRLQAYSFNGDLLWSFAPADFLGAPSIDADGAVYIGALDSPHIYALNPDGSVRWVKSPGTHGYSAPAIGSDGTIYVSDFDTLYALNPDGRRVWESRMPAPSDPIIEGNSVYIWNAINPIGNVSALSGNSLGPAQSSWAMLNADARQTAAAHFVELAPVLNPSLSHFEADGFHVAIGTESGATITVSGSDDLKNWTKIGSAVADSNFTTIVDPNPTGHRFYRAFRE